jgi:DNA-binding Xre family transcriptional regulator
MARTAALIDSLKRELKARNITYAALAKHLAMSEVSVKRMFAQKEFTLSRLDRICEFVGIEFSDLARTLSSGDAVISRLTYEQEKELVDDYRLMLVALCTLNHWGYERIVAAYAIPHAECIQLLARLDRLKFIELLPNNRVRLLVSRAFSWIPDGPIQRFFKEQVQADFFRSRFERENELLLLANGALSKPSLSALLARLRKTAAEFSGMRSDDAGLPFSERTPITLLLAVRPWEPDVLRKYRRASPAAKPEARAVLPMTPPRGHARRSSPSIA